MPSWYAGPSAELEAEASLCHRRRRASRLWRWTLTTTLKLAVPVCFVLSVGGQAAFVTPLYKNHLQAAVAAWWDGHDEMVDPSYLLLVGVAPTLLCVAVAHWLRRLRTRRGVWRVARVLRRRASPDWLSYGELLFLSVLLGGNALVFWYGFTKRHGRKPRGSTNDPGPPGAAFPVRKVGNALGFNCVFNLALLFLPATRNSAWMEFLNVSYANGIKFHRWLGVAAVLTGVVHCGCYYYGWLQDGTWRQMALPCWDCSLRERTGRKTWVNVFGEVALLCFLLLGATSVPWVRRNRYNLFYNVHQLLFLAVVFTALHWARALWFLLPTFVAYLTSRVLSHCNGATAAEVVGFTALSPSLCKLVVAHASSERGRYQVGQFVYVNVPAISRLEWHAFSLASAPPRDGESSANSMTLLIKALGDWTEKLIIYQQVCTRCSVGPEVYVDGYYGVSLADVYQSYSTVALVGGGVGLTPLLGVLEHICTVAETRQAQGRRLLPRRVAAIFAMRELELLKEISPLLARVRDFDPPGRYVSVHLTLTTTPRPKELDASLYAGVEMPRKTLPPYSFSQTRTFSPSTKNGCPFGTALGPSGNSIVHFVAFGVVVGLVLVFQFGNGALIDGLQDSVWVVQLAVKTSALFTAGICAYGGVALMRWARAALPVPCRVDEWGLKENLLPQARERGFSPDVSTFRDLLRELRVDVGRRPDVAVHLRELHAGHYQRCSGGESGIGVLVSGPSGLKTATARAAASVSATGFDLHEEEFEL
ncbi:ferric/cupric-chelate reductase [Phytophthora pseudosyringae]|uniref:Ferric/cupric-chelate reductase n=1 Tax=Phytophthora pseudosyringae TaxID=221518 RepID=A0A8T1VAV3_9STRA|nr:ferric/cupric-chelate reductase [Phytophthora pseudosyringae]